MEVCDKCYQCHWYWENNDTENECNGTEKNCDEFIEIEEEYITKD